jgi:pyruvate/2-oxoglutarate dehydrogenase complex dihydrolipoamide dehydrogenase (E3) component/uncharacterized membrane protein YdjX (TVP38/TMEM64 family)
MRRLAAFVALALVIGAAAMLAGGHDADWLRARVAALSVWRADHPRLLLGAYFAAYVAVTALSLPVAIWMTLAAGALFGVWTGTALVAVAATLGASLSFLAARYLLRDTVRARFGGRLDAVDAGVKRDGWLYLLTLRLIPVVPFFLVNLLMGLTAIPLGTFAWASFLGMVPATLLYVNAGTRLATIAHPADVATPAVIGSLVALGIFPWIARALMQALRRRRLYARWTRPARFDRNLVVIGAGATGLVASYIAAAVKARVTLVEEGRMGGDCLNYGCVPSKALIRSAKLAHQMRHADRYGLAPATPTVPFRQTAARIARVIADIAPHDSVERYRSLGVDVLQGRARLIDPWTVEIAPNSQDGGGGGAPTRLTTRSIIIATGARPRVPALPGLSEVGFLTSDTLWDRLSELDAVPPRLAVLGGGPIGCELAQAFARLGSEVTLIEGGPRLLSREDAEAAALVLASLRADGVEVLLDSMATAAGRDAGARWVEVKAQGTTRRIACDEILVAVGRDARLDGYGLEELGIPKGRVIETNDYLETLYPNIYAAGDVAGPFQLTHAGAHQAWFAAVNALFGQVRRFRADYRVLPAAVYTDPEIARVGLTEAEAQAKGIAVEVTRYGIDDLDRAIADSATEGFVKVLTQPGRDRILGVTIAGEHAGDLLAEYVLAMKHRIGLNGILSTVHSYPTLAEANKAAAGQWRKAHVNPRVLALLDRYHAWRRG